jgi:hypothetical protein
VRAVYDTLKALRSGAKPASIAAIASAELMEQVTRDRAYKRWAEAFLTPAGERR